MRFDQQCRVCSAPPSVRTAIDLELQKPVHERKRLRDLAAISGFSKSSLSRHCKNHLRLSLLEAHRAKSKKTLSRIVCVDLTRAVAGHRPMHILFQPGVEKAGTSIGKEDLRPDDMLLAVVMDPVPATFPNPPKPKIAPQPEAQEPTPEPAAE